MQAIDRIERRPADGDPKHDGSNRPPKTFDWALEGVRGIAALIVAVSHAVTDPRSSNFSVDPQFQPWSFLPFALPAHSAVLIFFILSGYVIGFSHQGSWSSRATKDYLTKRAIRLLPIYFLSLFVSIVVRIGQDSPATILSNAVFLQGITSSSPQNNPALWSLSCEVFYYLLFIGLWKYRPNLKGMAVVAAVVSLIGFVTPAFPQWVSSYSTGWVFWLLGLHVANLQPTESEPKVPLVSLFCLIAATNSLQPGSVLFNGLGLRNDHAGVVSAPDLFLIPIVLATFTLLAKRDLNYRKVLWGLAAATVVGQLALLAKMHVLVQTDARRTALALIGLGLVLLPLRFSLQPLRKAAPIGRISYALYVLHMPLLVAMHFYFVPSFAGSSISFVTRFVIWLMTTLSLAWALELVYQPFVKKQLVKKPA